MGLITACVLRLGRPVSMEPVAPAFIAAALADG